MIFILIINENDRSIIGTIYDKHYKRMLYMATKILGGDRGVEAVHDVFVKIIEQFENNVEILGDKPGNYFVIMVRNHSLNIKSKERLEFLPLEEELVDHDLFHFPATGPEEAFLNEEKKERLAKLIRSLPPSLRQAVDYRYIEGYSNIEIADILGISQSAVSTRIDKAKKRLREMIESEAADNAYD
jgi:RNA polymerase sigma-70 factor (ECF subfamily)